MCCAVPCRAVRCRAVPCRAVLCGAVMCHAVLCRAVRCRAVLCRAVLRTQHWSPAMMLVAADNCHINRGGNAVPSQVWRSFVLRGKLCINILMARWCCVFVYVCVSQLCDFKV
jgi:hypothetical protein